MGTILYIGFFSLPDLDAAAHRVMNNAKIFREIGYRVVFVDEQANFSENNILESEHLISGFKVYSTIRPRNRKSYLKKMLGIESVEQVIDVISDLEIVIAYNYPSVALNKLRRYCKKKNIKIISDCTEWYSGHEYDFPLSVLSKIDSEYRMKYVNKKLDGVICISSFLESYYKEHSMVVKIPPLIDKEEELWHQEKYSFDHDKLNIIYAGSPGRSKDLIKPIIDAVCECPIKAEIVLRIVGVTKEQYEERCLNDENVLDENNVLFLGRVTHKENVRLVGSSDCLVFMREKNRVSTAGFSTKFVEAITSNTAVITTDTSDMRSYIKKAGKGCVINGTEELKLLFSDMQSLRRVIFGKETSGDSLRSTMVPEDMFDYRKYINTMRDYIEKIRDLK